MCIVHQVTKQKDKDLLWHMYFTMDAESKSKYPTAICQECGKKIRRYHDSYEGMLRHLEVKHKHLWEEYLDDDLEIILEEDEDEEEEEEQGLTEAERRECFFEAMSEFIGIETRPAIRQQDCMNAEI